MDANSHFLSSLYVPLCIKNLKLPKVPSLDFYAKVYITQTPKFTSQLIQLISNFTPDFYVNPPPTHLKNKTKKEVKVKHFSLSLYPGLYSGW